LIWLFEILGEIGSFKAFEQA